MGEYKKVICRNCGTIVLQCRCTSCNKEIEDVELCSKCKGDKQMSTENEIEKELNEKGLNAPRLCPADIDKVIKSKTFINLPSGKCMICEITLTNGYTVRGESACVSSENFNQEIGEKISFEDARKKIWGLEAYLLQEKYPC